MSLEINIHQAIRSNNHYARSVKWYDGARSISGWVGRFDQIVQVLGFTNMSPGEVDFARAVAAWQKRTPPLKADGMLGPKTWGKLEPLTRFSVNNRGRAPSWLQPTSNLTTEISYILAAIDGTSSRKWINSSKSNSNVFKFFDESKVNGGTKQYFHGPVLLGVDVPNIIASVTNFIIESLIEISQKEMN